MTISGLIAKYHKTLNIRVYQWHYGNMLIC